MSLVRNNRFIKDNMMRHIYFANRNIKTFVIAMTNTITNKYSIFKTKIHFILIITTQIKPVSTSKST
jgi:hypothetical protein